MNIAEIPIRFENPASWYMSAFLVSFLVRISFLIIYGRIKKFPQVPWLIFIAVVAVVFVTGSYVLAESIPGLLDADVMTNGRTLIGGLIFAIPVALLMRKVLGLSYEIFNPYAYTLPIGIAIQRFGCIAAGCCYGKPVGSSLMSFQYFPGSEAYNHHFLSTGPILPFINVEPTQLYEIIGCLVLIAVLISWRSRFRSSGHLFIMSIVGYSLLRFLVEFSRDTSAHTLGVLQLWGLNTIQWILILIVIIFSVWLLLRERNMRNTDRRLQPIFLQKSNWISFFILLSGLIVFGIGKWQLPVLESMAITIAFMVPMGFLFYSIYLKFVITQLRWTAVILIGSCIILMGQTRLFEKDSTMVKKHILGLGITGGWTGLEYEAKNCSGGTIASTPYDNKHFLTGGRYTYKIEYNSSDNIEIGSNFFYGQIREETDLNQSIRKESIYGFTPFLRINTHKVGIGGGFHLGDFPVFKKFDYNNPVSSFDRYRMQPYFHFRFGDLSKLHMEFDYASQFPGPFPDNLYDFRLGFRPDPSSDTRLIFGTSSYTSLYMKPNFRPNNSLNLEPYIGFGGGALNEYTTTGIKGGLSVHYLLRVKRINPNKSN